MSDKISFQQEVERLESIVRKLEDPDTDLDTALALFAEGIERLNKARVQLEQTELTVKQVVRRANGEATDVDLDD